MTHVGVFDRIWLSKPVCLGWSIPKNPLKSQVISSSKVQQLCEGQDLKLGSTVKSRNYWFTFLFTRTFHNSDFEPSKLFMMQLPSYPVSLFECFHRKRSDTNLCITSNLKGSNSCKTSCALTQRHILFFLNRKLLVLN